MFRETIGNYKFNRYLNRKDYRALIRAMKKKEKNQYDLAQVKWLEKVSKNV
jgi:hypothetical protein